MRQPIQDESWYSYPGMVAIVTARHEGKQNIMASGWHTYIGSSPGIYGISLRKETYTYTLIEQSGAFGVHFLPAHCSEIIQAVGTYSGRDLDKFKEFNIEYEEGLQVDIPVLTDAYFAYECRTLSITSFGDHEWIAGEIVQRYRDDSCFLENGLPDFSKLEVPLYAGRSTYKILNQESAEKNHPLHLNRSK
ncbi:NADH-FMN oxidoreductase RutF, flavin reductase (DIM6/NTAB) family [Paenibacillus polysaccharolyticus]|uniref:NADH-FMN oxidoreductase RutF, flavin reductase (DIM6/NTAB) family n=1 Tax=Paenibacillus polysaccharolyticus TaxID=582692 RepID=A0A1G5D678_9BACL|nr:flavin reductase family protein [Paenibacillus polysaccharolyticus]SCY10047.1 NADH-FMN oxidoreductase RutF, flavin reductase (DIM6/NTAB) family [Paenibacillus polysaccharolyticus]